MSRNSGLALLALGARSFVARISGRHVAAGLAALSLVAASAPPVDSASWSGRYSIWRAGAFSTQRMDWSCVGATTQIMLNLVLRDSDRSQRNQLAYLDYAQRNSRYPVFDNGADPEGWAEALVQWGAGDGWGVAASSSMMGALETAARQMRETDKPVGLLVKQGSHAWVMTGFAATADPALDGDFTVTEAEVVGPLWPYGTLNGQPFDPAPRTWMSTSDLRGKFDAYNMPQSPAWNGRWITVIPDENSLPPGVQPPVLEPELGLSDPEAFARFLSTFVLQTMPFGFSFP